MKGFKKGFEKVLSSFLVVTMLASTLPNRSIAKENAKVQEPVQAVSKDTTKPKKLVGELTEKRERSSKRFFYDDTSFEAVVYPYPVHYEEKGQWKEIDNTLKDSKDEDKQDVLQGTQNSFDIKFAKQASSQKLVRLGKDKFELSWGLEGAQKSKAEVKAVDLNKIYDEIAKEAKQKVDSDTTLSEKTEAQKTEIANTIIENEKKKVVTKYVSALVYKDIYENVDLEYELKGDKLKENLVIKAPIKDAEFTFNIDNKNLVPVLQKDNSIIFYDSETKANQIFKMEAPVMFDSDFAQSSSIEVSLKESKKGYELTIKPDSKWLAAPERKYPVKIDPPVSTSLAANDIQDTFVTQYDNENKWLNEYLRVGYKSGIGITRSYIKFTLPQLNAGDMVVSATFGLYCNTTSNSGGQINVHKVTSDWGSYGITWAESLRPNFASKIEDFRIASWDSLYTWDITSIAKNWYEKGQNYGLMLKNNDETQGDTVFYSSDNSIVDARPRAVIAYVNNTGLEGYWTYHSASVGRGGTGHINDYNGNLIYIHNDLSMNGNKMPVSINHVYNSNDRMVSKFDSGPSTAYYGSGWRLNLAQRIYPVTIEGATWYKWVDEDGTSHYYKYDASTGKYKDESGIDSTLTINYNNGYDSGYCITDKKDNKLIFLSGGYLYKIEDSNGNKITLGYNGATLCTVTDGAGRVTTLESLPDGVLIGIIDPSGRKTSFGYNGSDLDTITYPDGKTTVFTYDINHNIKTVTNFDGTRLTYSYTSNLPYRVSNVAQDNTNNTPGGSLSIAYGYNQNTFTDVKGRKNVYQFNNFGNTVSIKDYEGNAEYNKFFDSGNIKNKLSLESKLQKVTTNILKNHNAEFTNDSWIGDYWIGSTGTTSFTAEQKYLGKQSLKVEKTNNSAAQYYSQTINLEKGKTYTFSAYVKTSGVVDNPTTKKGAVIFVNYQDASGTWLTKASNYIVGSNDWQRIEVTFTMPSDSSSTIALPRMGIMETTGVAYFDCLQLEEGTSANRYNLVENSNLNYSSSGIPTYWTRNGNCDSSDALVSYEGKNAFRFIGNGKLDKCVYQEVYVSGKSGDNFILSGWAKGDSVPAPDGSPRYFALYATFYNNDGTVQNVEMRYNQDNSDWQYASAPIITQKNYYSIVVFCLYYKNANEAYFDNINLYKEEFGTSYQYDSKGNITTTENVAKQNSSFEYSGTSDLIKKVDAKGNQFKYEYDTKHNITKAITSENVVYSFEYDNSGNPKKSTIGDISTLFIQSTAEYTQDENYIKSITDSSGNTVNFNYNKKKGILDTTKDAEGNTTVNTYDELDRLTGTYKSSKDINREFFSLENTTTGSKGSQPSFENITYGKDASISPAKYLYLSKPGSKLMYNLGLNKDSGTMAVWFNTSSPNTERYILNTESTTKMFNLYVGGDNRLKFIVGSGTSNTWIPLGIDTGYTVNPNVWNFVAVKWQIVNAKLECSVYLNNNVVKRMTFEGFKDFAGGSTALGTNINGGYVLNALMQQFVYSSSALSDAEIADLFSKGRHTPQETIASNGYSYENDRLKKILHNSFEYSFGYDTFGNTTTVTVGSQNLITNNYEERTGKLLDSKYGNGNTVVNTYDSLDRVIGKSYNGVLKFTYDFDARANLALHKDLDNKIGLKYNYDTSNRLISVLETDLDSSNDIQYTASSQRSLTSFAYDLNNNLKLFMQKIKGNGYAVNYSYDKDNRPLAMVYNNGVQSINGIENFSLSDTLTGSKGTKPYSENAFFVEDSNRKTVLASSSYSINLVANPSFESGTSGWYLSDWNGSTGAARLSSDSVDGTSSLEFYDSDGKTDGSETNAVAYQYIDLPAELTTAKDFSFSAYVKRSGVNQPKLSIQCINSAGTLEGGAYYIEEKSIPENQWTAISHKFVAPAKTKRFLLNIRTSVKDKNTVKFDGVQFEEKSIATPYQYPGSKILYNLGLNKNSGTMSIWFNTNTLNTHRYILNTESTVKMFNLFVGDDNRLKFIVGSGASNVWLQQGIDTGYVINPNEWYFTAIKWEIINSRLECSVYLNNNVVKKMTFDGFKDFAGGNTAIGCNVNGNSQLNGMLDQFNYTQTALSDAEVKTLYEAGRGNRVSYAYDAIGRLTNKTISISGIAKNEYKVDYTYVKGSADKSATTKVESINNQGKIISYSYDKNGNIKTVTQGSDKITYYYNQLNELEREDNPTPGINSIILYSYDQGGNIKEKKIYPYNSLGTLTGTPTAVTYSYGDTNWKDKLTNFNGKDITYDAIGNPKTYDNYTYTWENGRQLKTIVGNSKNLSFKYNDAGIRTQKVANGITTNYYLSGNKVTYEDNGTDKIYYTYDSTGHLVSMNLNGVEYYYIRNAQGDIIGLFDKTGTQVVSYVYDSWGKLISIDGSLKDAVGVKNPYRYRAYRYDTETGLYYLNARYYNPEWGRFMNSDDFNVVTSSLGSLTDKNLFSYCDNNPIIRSDNSGYFWHILAGAAAGALVNGAMKAISNVASGKSWDDGLGQALLVGAISGAIAVTGIGLVGQIALNAGLNAGVEAYNQAEAGDGYDLGKIAREGIIGGVTAALGGKGLDRSGLRNQVKMTFSKSWKAIKKQDMVAFKRAWKTYDRMSRYIIEELPESSSKGFMNSFSVNVAAKMYDDYQNGILGT